MCFFRASVGRTVGHIVACRFDKSKGRVFRQPHNEQTRILVGGNAAKILCKYRSMGPKIDETSWEY